VKSVLVLRANASKYLPYPCTKSFYLCFWSQNTVPGWGMRGLLCYWVLIQDHQSSLSAGSRRCTKYCVYMFHNHTKTIY
jgi:hypothetical protein